MWRRWLAAVEELFVRKWMLRLIVVAGEWSGQKERRRPAAVAVAEWRRRRVLLTRCSLLSQKWTGSVPRSRMCWQLSWEQTKIYLETRKIL